MAAPDQTPASLAQLFAQRRGRVGKGKPAPQPVPDRLGQFGLLFTEAEPEEEPPTETAPAPVERKLWAVAELVSTLRARVERDYADVWVEGEISNCRPAPSGHLYFTLKDGDAQLPVVLFRRQATLLRFRPEDGMAVLVRGRVSIFESRGQLQLIAEALEPRGAGALQLAFEQLKAKLRDEGLFDAERKRLLPAFPRTVGVITSTQGAVLHDIATVVRRRHACLNLLVFPAAMQGATCATDVARGLRYFNTSQTHRVDVIVIARGGGSAEDLAGFNDEALARAIAASELPVVSAVGHETDFTIADFVADLRAPTPSAAAELITAAQHRVEERVQALEARLLRGIRFQGMHAQQRFARVNASATLARMSDSLGRRQQRVDERRFRLEALTTGLLQARAARLQALTGRLQQGDVRRAVAGAQEKNRALRERLLRAGQTLLQVPTQRVQRAEVRLHALSPTAVLQRGYALAFRADGTLLRSADEVVAGDEITTRLQSGAVRSRVLDTVLQPEKEVA
ncbi:MAG: exodeoxyribonuclease VII large subunit [Janthinobacterium lividum]